MNFREEVTKMALSDGLKVLGSESRPHSNDEVVIIYDPANPMKGMAACTATGLEELANSGSDRVKELAEARYLSARNTLSVMK